MRCATPISFVKGELGLNRHPAQTNKQPYSYPPAFIYQCFRLQPASQIAPFFCRRFNKSTETLSAQQIRLWEEEINKKMGMYELKEPPRELLLHKTDGACVHEHSSRLYRQKCFDNDPREPAVRGLSGKRNCKCHISAGGIRLPTGLVSG